MSVLNPRDRHPNRPPSAAPGPRQRPGRRPARAGRVIVSRILAAFVVAVTPGVPLPPAAAGAAPPPEVRPAEVVILVDESRSLTDEDVRQERAAAQVLAMGEFSARSRVEVIGFGSRNTHEQHATDVVCPMSPVATPQDRQTLANCIGRLHRRTDAEGADTDHATAIQRALAALADAPQGDSKIVFLLTDGVLDVHASVDWPGNDATERRAAAQQDLRTRLDDARKEGVQVWPLGFGESDRHRQELAGLAAGDPCNGDPAYRPRARSVSDSTQVVDSMFQAFAAARCAGLDHPSPKVLQPGGTITQKLTIPPIATDASIIVVKYNPAFTVTYTDPRGHVTPKSGSFDSATFEVSGESSAVEVLHVRDPRPGTWTVKVTAPPGTGSQRVIPAISWVSAVRAALTIDPQAPRPGEKVLVRSRLVTRRGVLASPDELHGLSLGVRLTGDGFTGERDVPLTDDGKNRDDKAGDAVFSGLLTVPSTANGQLVFTGGVSGEGVQGDELPLQTVAATGGLALRAVVSIPARRIRPGGTAPGSLAVTNLTGAPKTLVLGLDDLRPGRDDVRIEPARVTLPASGTTRVGFRLTFGRGTALGRVPGSVVVSDTDGRVRYATGFIGVTVARTPPWWRRHWWQLALALLAVAASVAYGASVLRRRRAARDVRELTVVLYRGDQEIHARRAPAEPGPDFAVTLRETAGDQAYLDLPGRGDPAYVISRGPRGDVLVRTPEGKRMVMRLGRPEPIGGGLAIGVRDGRLDGDGGRAPWSRGREARVPPGGTPPGPDDGPGDGPVDDLL